MAGTEVACGRGCAGREPRFFGARGRRWMLMELSPGDSSRGRGATDDCRRPMLHHFLRFGSFGAVGSWAAWEFGCVSCAVSCCLGLGVTDSMRKGRIDRKRVV